MPFKNALDFKILLKFKEILKIKRKKIMRTFQQLKNSTKVSKIIQFSFNNNRKFCQRARYCSQQISPKNFQIEEKLLKVYETDN